MGKTSIALSAGDAFKIGNLNSYLQCLRSDFFKLLQPLCLHYSVHHHFLG
jgi:hypothetical protein